VKKERKKWLTTSSLSGKKNGQKEKVRSTRGSGDKDWKEKMKMTSNYSLTNKSNFTLSYPGNKGEKEN